MYRIYLQWGQNPRQLRTVDFGRYKQSILSILVELGTSMNHLSIIYSERQHCQIPAAGDLWGFLERMAMIGFQCPVPPVPQEKHKIRIESRSVVDCPEVDGEHAWFWDRFEPI